ncbi:hypothetical protein MCOR27_002241 [Pyricularia oryzae]|nr:hypothetical protein MCOR26_004527 [Pyricularia oryzae]KAI6285579.1 hypothetical protein MCOR27_002241 [Pyricularia oryzae]KAI6310643.1 hypothetical protein MCOR29_008548 [Pyricularia oryzae]KAI6368970.1 hypothetical protein MCOR31_005354 [Pyricularia oryzae]
MLYTTSTRCITTKHATVLKPAHNPDADGDNPIHIGKPGSHGEIERVSLKSRYTSDKGTTNKYARRLAGNMVQNHAWLWRVRDKQICVILEAQYRIRNPDSDGMGKVCSGNIGRGRLQRASNIGRELRKMGAEWNDLLPD